MVLLLTYRARWIEHLKECTCFIQRKTWPNQGQTSAHLARQQGGAAVATKLTKLHCVLATQVNCSLEPRLSPWLMPRFLSQGKSPEEQAQAQSKNLKKVQVSEKVMDVATWC